MAAAENIRFKNPLSEEAATVSPTPSPRALSSTSSILHEHPLEESARASEAVSGALAQLRAIGESDAVADLTLATCEGKEGGLEFNSEGNDDPASPKGGFAGVLKKLNYERLIFGNNDAEVDQAMEIANWERGRVHTAQPTGLWNGLLYPESQMRNMYDCVQLTAIVYTFWIVPYRLAFDTIVEPLSTAWWFDVFVDLTFIFDMFLTFFAYIRDKATGELIKDGPTIRRRYLRGFFIIDFVACFPVDHILLILATVGIYGAGEKGGEYRNARLLRTMRMMRTARLARILRLLRTSRLHRLDRYITIQTMKFPWLRVIYKVFTLWMFIFAVAHVVGCVWLHDGIVHAGLSPHGSWVDRRGWYDENSICCGNGTVTCMVGSSGDPEIFAHSIHVLAECLDVRITHGHMYWESMYYIITTSEYV